MAQRVVPCPIPHQSHGKDAPCVMPHSLPVPKTGSRQGAWHRAWCIPATPVTPMVVPPVPLSRGRAACVRVTLSCTLLPARPTVPALPSAAPTRAAPGPPRPLALSVPSEFCGLRRAAAHHVPLGRHALQGEQGRCRLCDPASAAPAAGDQLPRPRLGRCRQEAFGQGDPAQAVAPPSPPPAGKAQPLSPGSLQPLSPGQSVRKARQGASTEPRHSPRRTRSLMC